MRNNSHTTLAVTNTRSEITSDLILLDQINEFSLDVCITAQTAKAEVLLILESTNFEPELEAWSEQFRITLDDDDIADGSCMIAVPVAPYNCARLRLKPIVGCVSAMVQVYIKGLD
jgi:hypothetical protein